MNAALSSLKRGVSVPVADGVVVPVGAPEATLLCVIVAIPANEAASTITTRVKESDFTCIRNLATTGAGCFAPQKAADKPLFTSKCEAKLYPGQELK